ncbi:MAG: TatD family deoxyribonuclease [Burkholderiales bacterium]|nr:MAG: TatD family deoxyribonuclease [Burkholderiales bacterium]
MWIDTHCHLDAPEFGAGPAATDGVRRLARERGVALCVLPAVEFANFETVRQLAHRHGDAYALGIHPLYVPQADDRDLARLDEALARHRDDPRLVAVGEIGLDFFVPALCEPAMRERQVHFCREQLRLARRHGLPVILHVRKSADALLRHLRELPTGCGIAHAFNGSPEQARAFLALGFRLGFGGATTFDTARRLRALAADLPLDALVLETDAPDIPPQWLYTPAAERAAGRAQGVNTPAELPRIGELVAALRGLEPRVLAEATTANAKAALPRLRALLPEPA